MKVATFDVVCKVCNHKTSMSAETAKKIASRHDGFIPCTKCGSHATQWDTDKIK